MIDSKTKLYCIIGNPVKHSLSPQMHNEAFKTVGFNAVFLAFCVSNVKTAIEGLKEIGVGGIVVTIPHKKEVIRYLDHLDKHVQKIGAVNAIVNKNGRLFGTNTDWIGAIKTLEEKTLLSGKKVALLGAGGAARAIIYGLQQKKAHIAIFNRNLDKAKRLAREFNIKSVYFLTDEDKLANADIIINATSVGMGPNDSQTPITGKYIHKNQTIFDIVYTPCVTQFLKIAKRKGATIVYGYKMVLYGGVKIFELFTGQKAPINVMKNTLTRYLTKVSP